MMKNDFQDRGLEKKEESSMKYKRSARLEPIKV